MAEFFLRREDGYNKIYLYGRNEYRVKYLSQFLATVDVQGVRGITLQKIRSNYNIIIQRISQNQIAIPNDTIKLNGFQDLTNGDYPIQSIEFKQLEDIPVLTEENKVRLEIPVPVVQAPVAQAPVVQAPVVPVPVVQAPVVEPLIEEQICRINLDGIDTPINGYVLMKPFYNVLTQRHCNRLKGLSLSSYVKNIGGNWKINLDAIPELGPIYMIVSNIIEYQEINSLPIIKFEPKQRNRNILKVIIILNIYQIN